MTINDVAKIDDDLADLVTKHKVPGLVALARDGEDWLIFSYAQTDVDVIITNVLREWIEKSVSDLKNSIAKELGASCEPHASPDNPASTTLDGQIVPENQIGP